jgi:hypothetical protein
MPYSAEEGQALMMSWIHQQNPQSMLDIGAGSGTYGRLMRNAHPSAYRIGIEAWAPYVSRFRLVDVYDHVITADVRMLEDQQWPMTDIVILGDVLEHMSEKDAVLIWERARCAARKAVYLSIPIIHYPQGHVEGNPYEEHVVDDWTDERVLDTFEGITWKWLGTIVGRYEAITR